MDNYGRVIPPPMFARPPNQGLDRQNMDGIDLINNRGRGRIYRYQGRNPAAPRHVLVPAPRHAPVMVRMKIEEDVLSYTGSENEPPGLYSAINTIDCYDNYFEIEIMDVGDLGQICIGLVPDKYPTVANPGAEPYSVGYMADTGKLYLGQGVTHTGPVCGMGDRLGVGIKPLPEPIAGERANSTVFFTRNGIEVKSFESHIQPKNAFPAVSMNSEGEEAFLRLEARWSPEDVTQMMVDCGEEDWRRLDDVRLNGTTLEYAGRGHTIHDVGLAQAKYPLDTTNHYFEFEIINPGKGCYVAIGLAKLNYPMRRHPGWNKGSIAYHADDGKLFHGSGMGVRFGPRCSLGDVMGCGIFFPPDYDSDVHIYSAEDEEGSPEDDDEEGGDGVDSHFLDGLFSDEESEHEEVNLLVRRFKRKPSKGKETTVTVFFTRNGKLVGHREVVIPRGGFYPTIGMLSSNEKVRVDLHPLTG